MGPRTDTAPLATVAETASAPLSFLLYRTTRFAVHRLVRWHTRRHPAQATTWQTLDGQSTAEPLNLLALMTSAPRWNTHALIALAGPLRVRHTLRVHTGTATTCARSWTVVIHDETSRRIVASLGPAATTGTQTWQAIDLPPGGYRLALRYYHWSEPVTLPAVEVDGVPAVPATPVPADINDFYHDLAERRSLLYTCLHSYVRTLLRYRHRLPGAFVAREYLPAGNPRTTFHYGLTQAGTRLRIDLEPGLLATHDVYLTTYNRASFPVLWHPLTQPQHTTPPIPATGTYLLRIHATADPAPGVPATAVRVTSQPAGPAPGHGHRPGSRATTAPDQPAPANPGHPPSGSGTAMTGQHRSSSLRQQTTRPAAAATAPAPPPVPTGASRLMYRHGRLVHRLRWLIVAGWTAVLLASIPLAAKTPSVLQGGGYFNISGEAVSAEHIRQQQLHQPLSQVVVVFQATTTPVTDPAYQQEIDTFATRAGGFPNVTTATPGDVGPDGRSTYVLVGFDRDPDYMQGRMSNFRALLPHQNAGNPARAYLTGTPAVYDTLTRVTVDDVERADATALPVALIVLLIVFATAVAATMPLLLGLTAVPTALAIIYLIARHTPTTSFILSVASIIGLGISIDYSLLITRRFREELHRAGPGHLRGGNTRVREAVATTTATAGEAILFSGSTVMIGFLGLLIIGVPITTSFAIGGAVVVAVAALAALTLLPALLSILGRRVDAGHIPLPGRRRRAGPTTGQATAPGDRPGHDRWHSWALAVMRRPTLAVLAAVALLALLALPALTLKTGVPGADVLPSDSTERQGQAILQQQFPDLAQDPIYVVARTADRGSVLTPAALREIDQLTRQVAAQPHVTSVTSLTRIPPAPGSTTPDLDTLIALYSNGNYRQIPALAQFVPSVAAGDSTVIVARSDTTLDSPQGKHLIQRLRAQPDPPGLHLLVGGLQALSLDLDHALYRNFPLAILAILAATFLLLLVMFRSILLPLKAVVMNTLSVAATYGALVYIFQHGSLGFPRVGFIDAIIPILLFCILFGLSMDYEVFLLSRIREEWQRTADNRAAVATGLARTAGVITSAALLFVIVTGAFSFASLVTTQEIGVGMAVAVLVDATIIRLLLVPATMRLLGRWNWWLPGRGDRR